VKDAAAEFLKSNREELISRCRVKGGETTRHGCNRNRSQIRHSLFPGAQLTETLRAENLAHIDSASGPSESAERTIAIRIAAADHGNELLLKGFTVDELVHDYGDLCQAVTDLAIERMWPSQ
jgi:hypothetical protein